MSTLGAHQRSIEWEARTDGSARYVGDVELDLMVFCCVVRSPHSHARIRGIDVRRAARAPGVVAVLTGADLPDRRYPHMGPVFADRYPLAREVVRFVGEEVAVVAAESPDQAEAAARLVRVRYRRLPAVTTVDEALRPGAPTLHDRAAGGNVSTVIRRRYGDSAAARRATDAVITNRYRFNRQSQAPMETDGTVARWDPAGERLELWTSTQSPYFVREEVAAVFGLDIDQVVTREVAVGGGFGAKSKITDHEVLAAAVAMATGRPARLVLSRAETFATTKCRHDMDITLTSGATAAGRLTFRDATVAVDNGAYNHSGPSVSGSAIGAMASLYRTDSVDVDLTLVDTNKHPGGQFRGYGGIQALFAVESQLDELARELELDPLQMRIDNANLPGDVTHAGWRLHSAALVECLEAVRAAIDWDAKRRSPTPNRGVGVACSVYMSGVRTYEDANKSGAIVEVNGDGDVLVRFGGADPGTGQKTILAQIAGTELGVAPERVHVQTMDSDETPYDLGSWSTRGTVMGGHAVGQAARRAAEELRTRAASKLHARVEDVALDDGAAVADGRRVSLGDLAALSDDLSGRLRIEETYVADIELVDPATGVNDYSLNYSFCAHAVEVEVDPATGGVRVLDYVAAHDSGTVLNPVAFEGQVVGGVVMGLGAALGEQLVYEGGRMVNPSYLHYPMARAADAPPVRCIVVGGPDPRGPYGAKGVGEISMTPAPAAVANAVADATGVRLTELPLSPDRVLNALRDRDGTPTRRHHIWRRPDRWWVEGVRRAYPLGLHRVLHEWGTRLARTTDGGPIEAIDSPTDLAGVHVALSDGRAAPLGGGTDLLPARGQGLSDATRLVDLTAVAELGGLVRDADGTVRIGATTALADLERGAAGVGLPVLARTVTSIASAQIREMATVGGNLCQQKRCWFFRNGFSCYKRGGSTCPCYAVTGDNRYYHAVVDAHRCQAVTPSDLATTFAALAATAHVSGPDGERALPVDELYRGPGETALGPGEILTGVVVPPDASSRRNHFVKLNLWQGDFAVVSAAVSLDVGGTRVHGGRVVLGGVGPVPLLVPEVVEALRRREVAAPVLDAAAEAWTRRAHPLPGNTWKVDAAVGVLRSALETALGSPEERTA